MSGSPASASNGTASTPSTPSGSWQSGRLILSHAIRSVPFCLDTVPEWNASAWLNLDATDDPLHGEQEGSLFHGYCGHYCYLPL
jgi:hypothetical protein